MLAITSSVFVSMLGSGGYSDEGWVWAARDSAASAGDEVSVVEGDEEELKVLIVRKGRRVDCGADMREVMGSDRPALIFWIEKGV